MDILKHITKHTEKLKTELSKANSEQKKNLKISTLEFYFIFPEFEATINKYIEISIEKSQLISNIISENLKDYRKATENSNAEVDVYANDYEEPEQNEIFILNAFENAISDIKNTTSLVDLFIGIIDTLDYYENFSENPEYWNNLLVEEVNRQNEILKNLHLKSEIDTLIYQKAYSKVEF
jgi:hypothetical protein